MAEDFERTVSLLRKKLIMMGKEVQTIYEKGKCALVDEAEVINFKGMYNALERYYSNFEKLWFELLDVYDASEKQVVFPNESDSTTQKTVRRSYYGAHTCYETLMQRQTTAHNNTTINETKIISSKLPEIDLPKFNGDIEAWPKFRQSFVSLIDKDPNLSDIQKLHYLNSCLTDAASSIVSESDLEAGNYHLAWKCLMDMFENKRVLASTFLNKLFNFKSCQGKATIAYMNKFLTVVAKSISAFKDLNIPDEADFILLHISLELFDEGTREKFEEVYKKKNFPTFSDLVSFVREESVIKHFSQSRAVAPSKKDNVKKVNNQTQQKPKNVLMSTIDGNQPAKTVTFCFICKSDSHSLLNCPTFYKKTSEERLSLLKGWKGCRNCLSSQHPTTKCSSKWRCRICKSTHHTLLHLNKKIPKEENHIEQDVSNEGIPSPSSASLNATSDQRSQVILGTIQAQIQDARGKPHTVRMVLDSGSQHSFITKKMVNRLGLTFKRAQIHIQGIGQTTLEGSKGKVTCKLIPIDNKNDYIISEAIIINNITSYLPTATLPTNIKAAYTGYKLADPMFFTPGAIDFLIGADIYPDIVTGPSIAISNSLPRLVPSIFGNIVIGKIHCPSDNEKSTSLFTVQDQDHINESLTRFWEIEEASPSLKVENPDDIRCEEHFQKTHYRLSNGVYVVKLPFKQEPPNFEGSQSLSLRRFINLETKLRKNELLKQKYDEFMREYIHLGHMGLTQNLSKCVIPHHSVVKGIGHNIKIRVVFDASSKTTLGSLNDHLMPGPKLQNDLRDILLNFRTHRFVFTADLVKMYRNILVDPEDRTYQHIYWRFSEEDSIEKYELATVTYGLASAPFLALRVLAQLGRDEGHKFPKAAQILQRDVYVDDVVTGARTLEEANELKQQLIGLMACGGFSLSKWASNSPELLKGIAEKDCSYKNFDIEEQNNQIKILGLRWDPRSDNFNYQISPFKRASTKRGILSVVSRIFDPLGFLTPTVILFKSFIQELWKAQLDWDEELTPSLQEQWNITVADIHHLSDVKIPRFIGTTENRQWQIVGFADASSKAYCATLYVRIQYNGHIKSQLLAAKSKLAPVKTISIPRLELCGAHLLVKLYKSVSDALNKLQGEWQPSRFFLDSTIALAWINTPPYKLNVFVANRVSDIVNTIPPGFWAHVKSEDNPSDAGSRGILPSNLVHNNLWWNGPDWLTLNEEEWRTDNVTTTDNLPDLKRHFITSNFVKDTTMMDSIVAKFSNLEKLFRVMAYILRFINNSQRIPKFAGPINFIEVKAAQIYIIKQIQLYHFLDGRLNNFSKFERDYSKISPFLDQDGLIRVGGRLRNANLSYNHRHPILLPKSHHFTNILIDYFHKIFLHPGPSLLQSLIQTKFWIPSLRRVVRKRTFLCVKCYRCKPITYSPKMADLPSYRVNAERPFQFVGVDYAGPFLIRDSLRRKPVISKAYMCLFICLTCKAVHLEAVSNLSTNAFLAAFDRFIARRGIPQEMYSDNGTNFVGASHVLKEIYKWLRESEYQDNVSRYACQKGFVWKFIPPSAPHFGGIWEAGVKSAKKLLNRITGSTPLTFEELSTMFNKIEAVLNSRPLCPSSTSPHDLEALTPGHFLIGRCLTSVPEPCSPDVNRTPRSRWQLISQMTEDFWKRWRLEYLSTLQTRAKWRTSKTNPQVGDLVLLKDSNALVSQWPMGRISKVYPGADNIIRVVDVRTSSSEYKRPLVKLAPLLPLTEKPFDS